MSYKDFVFCGRWRTLLEGFDEETAKEILWQIMLFNTTGEITTNNPMIRGLIIGAITYQKPNNKKKESEYLFTQIPHNNDNFFAENKDLSIIHLYILERVRSFQAKGQPCYISNEQLAKELNFSVSTVKRALKLLMDKNFLYVKYGDNGKRRTLYIYDKEMERYKQKKNAQSTT